MKFTELSVGDWFNCVHDGGYNEYCIFIKTTDTNALALNYCVPYTQPFDGNAEINFISAFSVTIAEATDDTLFKTPNDATTKISYHNVSMYGDIPVGAIYKGRGVTFYKKMDETTSVVFWSPNSKTMGNAYSTPDPTRIGHYYVCDAAYFEYPEEGNFKIPYAEPDFAF